jgi:glycine cleavage system H protein
MTTSRPPDQLRYTKDHEWARVESDGTVTVGITTHAVDQLGDITLVTLPAVGTPVEIGKRFGDIDSVKAVSELFAPISGEIVAVNDALKDSPELVNTNPYGDGWMVRIRPAHPAELDGLLTSADYERLLADGG